MPAFQDLTGSTINNFQVISREPNNRCNHTMWRVRCKCGVEKVISYSEVKKNKSCGCRKFSTRVYKIHDMCGRVFGSLKVIGSAERRGDIPYWRCLCVCGKVVERGHYKLRDRYHSSCGCRDRIGNRTHGLAKTSEYNTWASMKQRCRNRKCKSYPRYGGRGIAVCERWKKFENFLADMGPKPAPGYTIERLDIEGDYNYSNCRWIPKGEQSRNRSNVIMLEHKGKRLCVAEWARVIGMNRLALSELIRHGWTISEILKKKGH